MFRQSLDSRQRAQARWVEETAAFGDWHGLRRERLVLEPGLPLTRKGEHGRTLDDVTRALDVRSVGFRQDVKTR